MYTIQMVSTKHYSLKAEPSNLVPTEGMVWGAFQEQGRGEEPVITWVWPAGHLLRVCLKKPNDNSTVLPKPTGKQKFY